MVKLATGSMQKVRFICTFLRLPAFRRKEIIDLAGPEMGPSSVFLMHRIALYKPLLLDELISNHAYPLKHALKSR